MQELIAGEHQCLVAEIAYSPDPIQPGETPGTTDKLAQRNLVIVPSDNPGNRSAHTIQHTLEIRPSAARVRALDEEDGPEAREAAGRLDELLIFFRDIPRTSFAQLYSPSFSADEMVRLAGGHSPAGRVKRLDAHTIQLPIADLVSLPLPPRKEPIRALLSVELPRTVRAGQDLRFHVRHVDGATRQVIGTAEVLVPVRRPRRLLLDELIRYAVLQWIRKSVPRQNTWAPVWDRYLAQVRDRVEGLGWDPDRVIPSPAGVPDLRRWTCLRHAWMDFLDRRFGLIGLLREIWRCLSHLP